MAHISENAIPLTTQYISITDLESLDNLPSQPGQVYLFRLPPGRTDQDAACSQQAFQKLAAFCASLDSQATVCILTTPPDAARLHPYLESSLRFQLWVAIKTSQLTIAEQTDILPQQHVALLIFTRYSSSLIHTQTRIAYTYCPACGKTTKDYGGKKHLHHVDGTLISDVWRDIVVDPNNNIEPITQRLRDLFGLAPYSTLTVLDFSQCSDLAHRKHKTEQIIDGQQGKLQPNLRSRLIQGDCLKVLKRIPDNSVDFCFADLPYNLHKKYSGYNDTLESQEYFAWCNRWLSQLARVLKPGRTCAVLNIPLWAIRHFQYLATVLDFQAWIVWEALAFPVRQVMPAHYAILCFSKGAARPLPGLLAMAQPESRNKSLFPLAEFFCIRPKCVRQRNSLGISDRGPLLDLWYDIHRLKHNARRIDHPCQLPPALMHRLISLFTSPGEVVLDCLNGAGTSTLAAQQLGRRYIGIELSEQYHKLALQRHEELSQGIDPFGKKDSIPTAKNSPVPRLPKRTYQVSKKVLQLDVKRIAQQLGRLPSHAEVEALSSYPIEYFDNYFVGWGEVCAAARTTGMSELPVEASTEIQLTLFADSTDNRKEETFVSKIRSVK